MDENTEVECTGKKVQSTDSVYFRRNVNRCIRDTKSQISQPQSLNKEEINHV